jgi:hypothetical protein
VATSLIKHCAAECAVECQNSEFFSLSTAALPKHMTTDNHFEQAGLVKLLK